MTSSNAFTVGWISALSTELTAARQFLDEEYPSCPPTASNDSNVYTVGRIGSHNVVIATLPDGEYGLVSAASVATNMLNSFPHVRIGLMVGIAGGAPSERHDIRLGDVVVSSPHSKARVGGVWQYDFGRTTQQRAFQTTGFLNQPSPLLRAAVADLRSRIEENGIPIADTVEKLLSQKLRLRKKYSRPLPATDVLYNSSFVHDSTSGSCCKGEPATDELHQVQRRPRVADEEDDPAVHYGVIASANRLMRDALIRDTLARDNEVLCFDTEAAGLMNHFPCLVIRGICDYSDTHKGDVWQGFAAMSAAAYAKELLKRIPPHKIDQETKLVDQLAAVETQLRETHVVTQQTQVAVANWKAVSDRRELFRWLNAPDPNLNLDAARRLCLEGTGRWFLDSPQFASWKAARVNVVWLHGIPGCGKTILSSTIISALRADEMLGARDINHGLAFFFFSFTDVNKQALEQCLRSLIQQLSDQAMTRTDDWKELFDVKHGTTQPSLAELKHTLQTLMTRFYRVRVVLDALDERHKEKSPSDPLLEWLVELLDTKHVQVLITSRSEPDIEQKLSALTSPKQFIQLQANIVNKDILAYVQHRLRTDGKFQRWKNHPAVRHDIENTLMTKADGMFRWVQCQLDQLADCKVLSVLQETLDRLSRDLYGTYDRIMDQIRPEDRGIAIRLLQFLAYSHRPLRIDEAIDAIAVRLYPVPSFNIEDRMPDASDIGDICPSLITLNLPEPAEDSVWYRDGFPAPPEGLIQLAHFSVKEYLLPRLTQMEQRSAFRRQDVISDLAKVSLTYLLQLDHAMIFKDMIIHFPLSLFAAREWTRLFRDIEAPDEVSSRLAHQLLTKEEALRTWLQLFDPDRKCNRKPWRNDVFQTKKKERAIAAPLYFAACTGLRTIVRRLLQNGADIDESGGDYGNALQAASAEGHIEIVKLLIENSVDINTQGGCYGNALQAASSKGHIKIVKLLIENGIDINAQGKPYGNALQAASAEGYVEIARLLIENNIDINAQGGVYSNALQAASIKRHIEIVKLLIENNVDINAQGEPYGSALVAASVEGCIEIVKLLIQNNVDVNAPGLFHGNALCAASVQGHIEIVKLLIENNVDINAQGGIYGNALQAASVKGHIEIVKLLLENNVDVNARGEYGNALRAARKSYKNSQQVVQLLIDNGAQDTYSSAWE